MPTDSQPIAPALIDLRRHPIADLRPAGGRNTQHRVTRVSGTRPCLVPVLWNSVQPDLMNSEEVRLLFWGRRNGEAA